MASSSCFKLKALLKKNVLILKRNCCSTCCELFFPIILIFLLLLIRGAFKVEKVYFNEEEKNYSLFTTNRAFANIKYDSSNYISSWYDQPTCKKIFYNCYNEVDETRYKIADINIPNEIKEELINVASISDPDFNLNSDSFLQFESVEKMNEYVSNKEYGNEDNPLICFGISFQNKENNKYEYHLHYFSDSLITNIPYITDDVYNQFRAQLDFDSYEKWYNSGFIYIQKIISDWILKKELNNNNAQIDFVMRPMEYTYYKEDIFAQFVGYIVPFFIIISYICPLCLYVLRMVGDKESKAKEGMKIMGLSESIYFLSYFLQYLICIFIQSFINSILMLGIFKYTPFHFMFLTLFLWGMSVFGLIYFFQSFIDRTRVALILSILLYFIMYFLSMVVNDTSVKKLYKIIMSIFPPVGIQLGIVLIGRFEAGFIKIKFSHIKETYLNYSIGWMYLMFIIDFFFYLFLGFYLQNVLNHEFGISRPFYFLCTTSYWCGSSKKNQKLNQIIDKNSNEIININKKTNKDDFENEDIYKEKTNINDVINIIGIKKEFDDGKIAVNGVNLNLYKDEIFALLGHNGAGKTTLINILTGMYDATEGSVIYNNVDILDSVEMDKFRNTLGICPQHDVLFDELTIREHLNMFATFKGVSDNLENEVNKTLNDFQLLENQNNLVKNLSAGEKRKLSIAIALVGGSEVIFLDEPSSGMDITSRRRLWEILKRISNNKIIILTTHYMEEASVLGNRIGIMHSGELKCLGSPLFLINRFGKYISLRITKNDNADNNKIIKYIQSYTKDIEYEILSEEIMFRIPQSNFKDKKHNESLNLNFSSHKNKQHSILISHFFQDLDNNLEKLHIKNYSASMPTLEDVFLNVAADDTKLKTGHRKFSQVNDENDKILFDTNFEENESNFCSDFKACMKKRWLMTRRDIKGVFMEILVPIFLIVVGLIVCQVSYSNTSLKYIISIGKIGKQNIYYGSYNNLDTSYFMDNNDENVTSKNLILDEAPTSEAEGIRLFSEKLNSLNDENNLGSIYILKLDTDNNKYEYVIYSNTIVSAGPVFFSTYFFEQMINYALVKNNKETIEIKVVNEPMVLTAELENQSEQSTNSTMVFFVAVAFSLIPANFVTIIVKERLNNSKHLMKISGMSLFAYWLVNFLFELIKYYFTVGICMILIYFMDFYPTYFIYFYFLYGPPMILFTYCLSFLFETESSAQNSVLLLNFLIGALGSTVALMFRMIEKFVNIGKLFILIFGIVPSFDITYGYDFLLNYLVIFMVDSDEWYKYKKSKVLNIEYAGMQLAYLILLTFIYLFILFCIEQISNCFCEPSNKKIDSKFNDSDVIKEYEKANNEDNSNIILNNDNNKNKNNLKEYAIRIENLRKTFSQKSNGCCGEKINAVNNLNLCVEYGECFGLLGINGAGKTTTFKCITQELNQNNGKIFINGLDISHNFSEVKKMFGYCPQFDAIFEFMTVYENLEFYALIKGIKKHMLDKTIRAMIEEMSLIEFVDKIAGKLSGGNKRKLSVAISMICNPPIILLDEPSTGMDPEARRFMWAVIHKVSSRRKRSAVIMTTHLMDEAETLCKRMGIMVNGQFVCLGSSYDIKEKYGYGFEIDIRLKPLSNEEISAVLKRFNFDKNYKINYQNIGQTLEIMNKKLFINELNVGRLGEKLINHININGFVSITYLINWIHYNTNVLNIIKKAKEYFNEIILTEFIDNNFLFKIKKESNSKSIGFLFGLFENYKDEFYITEYSIQKTSLEQIFNQFAEKQIKEGQNSKIEEQKTQIPINNEMLKLVM